MRVRVAVVVHVVPAEQHLALRAAVEEDDGGPPLAGRERRRTEELRVDRHPVGGREDERLRNGERRLGELGGNRSRGELALGARAPERITGDGWSTSSTAE